MIVAIRRGSGAFVDRTGPDAVLDAGDVLIGVGSADEIRRLEELFAPRGARRWLTPSSGSRARCRRGRRRSGRARATRGSRARRLRDERRAAARRHGSGGRRARSPRSWRRPQRSSTASRARRSPGPGFVNLELGRRLVRADARERRSRKAATSVAAPPASPERVQVEMVSANPTGPMTVASARNGAYGDCVARLLAFAGHTVEREYYYNDAGGQMDRFRESVEAVRRGEEPPEDGYHGDYIAALAQDEGDPVPRMLALIEAALERFRIQFDSFERQSVVETGDPGGDRAARHLRGGRRAVGPHRRRTATRRTASSSAPTGRRRTSPPMPPTCAGSTRRASTGSSTCSVPTITATSGGCRRSRRCSAIRATRWRC